MRVELDNGLVGWGESYGAQLDAMPALFTGRTEPLAVGQDAGDRRLTSTIQQGALPSIVLEAVFLMKARRHRCRYLWINHVGKARKAGLDDDTVMALGKGLIPETPAAVRAAARFEQSLAEEHRVPQPVYDDVEAELGSRGLVDLMVFCGFASSVAMLLNVRQPKPPTGAEAPF